MAENAGTIYYDVDINTQGAIDAQREVKSSTQSINSSLESITSSSSKASSAIEKTGAAAKSGGEALAGVGKKAGAASIQVQQFVGQVQGGVNPMIALSQQAADLGIVLGLPLLGSVVGIAAAFAGPFITSLFGATNSIETLDEALSKIGKSFETAADGSDILSTELTKLAKISKDAVKIRLIVEEEDAKKALDGVRATIADSAADILSPISIGLSGIIERGGLSSVIDTNTLGRIQRETKLTAQEIYGLAKALDTANLEPTEENFNNLATAVVSLKDKYGDSNASVNELSSSLSEQIGVAFKATESIKRLEAANANLDKTLQQSEEKRKNPQRDEADKELERRANLAKRIIAQQQTQFQDEQTLADEQLQIRLSAIGEARQQQLDIGQSYDQAEYEARALHAEKLASLDEQRTNAEKAESAKRLQAKQAELAAYAQLGGQLSNLMATIGAEQSALGKAIFLANQALAVASIIVDTEARAAPFLGTPLYGQIKALGYASAGIAAGVAVGETFAGRQTGGPVQAGSAYRVNEAGAEGYKFSSAGREYIQMLGGSGEIVPADKIGGSGVQVSVTVNNGSGVGANVSSSDDGRYITIDTFRTDMAENGPMSRSMVGAFNGLKRRTE